MQSPTELTDHRIESLMSKRNAKFSIRDFSMKSRRHGIEPVFTPDLRFRMRANSFQETHPKAPSRAVTLAICVLGCTLIGAKRKTASEQTRSWKVSPQPLASSNAHCKYGGRVSWLTCQRTGGL